MSTLLWILSILGVLAACGVFLLFFPGAFDPPSLKRARAARWLSGYAAWEKADGDVPLLMVDGCLMYMDPDGQWRVFEKVDGQE